MPTLQTDCRKRLWLVFLAPALVLCSLTARAQDFTVDSTVDAADATSGDSRCADASNHCTLRAAIQTANQVGGTDNIFLPAGLFALSLGGTGNSALVIDNGSLNPSLTLNLVGSGAGVTTIDGGRFDTVFNIAPNGTSVSVTISNVTIRGGVTTAPEVGFALTPARSPLTIAM